MMRLIALRVSRLTRSGFLVLILAAMGTPSIAQTQATPAPTFADAAPREVWTAIPGFEADPHWSEDFYAVRRGAVRPRMALWSETAEEKATLAGTFPSAAPSQARQR